MYNLEKVLINKETITKDISKTILSGNNYTQSEYSLRVWTRFNFNIFTMTLNAIGISNMVEVNTYKCHKYINSIVM